MTVSHSTTSRAARCMIGVFLVATSVALWAVQIGAQSGQNSQAMPYELYLEIDGFAVWIGDTVRYTVYEPTVVEARILSASGEIILLYRLGKQEPGQYTLPWDGTYSGSPLFGVYKFELYFGDEFAAEHFMTINMMHQTP